MTAIKISARLFYRKMFGTDLLSLRKAATLLKEGGLVAFPTETVYGLGALISNPVAIAEIFAVKKRPQDNPLIAHIASLKQMEEIAVDIPDAAYVLAEEFFPGPLTLVLKKARTVPDIVTAGQKNIALRMPNHFVARELIELVEEPIVAPSANLSGKPSSTEAMHVLRDFGHTLSAIINAGPTQIGIESTVLSLIDPKKPLLLRPGNITAEQIEEVLKCTVEREVSHENTFLSPGMRYRHYAPNAQVLLFSSQEELRLHVATHPSKKRMIATPHESTLYAILRQADIEGHHEICFLLDETLLNNKALMNRLLLASRKK